MKRIIFLAVAMFCSFLSVFGANSGPKFYHSVPVSYEYSYSGMMRDPIDWYSVRTEEGVGVTISYSHDGPEITVIKAPEGLLEKIGEIACSSKLYKLKASYRPKLEVLDGYGWFMSIRYKDDSIWSGGSNAWPPSKLWGGIAAINQLVVKAIENASGEDILRHESRY